MIRALAVAVSMVPESVEPVSVPPSELPPPQALKAIRPESATIIRCVEIKGYDLQACGGTHVKNTREIGTIRITDVESKGQGRRRVELVAEPFQ